MTTSGTLTLVATPDPDPDPAYLLRETIGSQVATRLRITSQEGATLTDRYMPAVSRRLDQGQATVYDLVGTVCTAFREEANQTYGCVPPTSVPLSRSIARQGYAA